MLQLLAILKSKALLLEKETWGHLTPSLAGTKTSGLWDILEDLFMECSDSEEEERPPSNKTHQEDEPSTSSGPSKSTPSSAPSFNMIIPMSEGSLHDSGISLECLLIHEQLLHRKVSYLCTFECSYPAQSRATV